MEINFWEIVKVSWLFFKMFWPFWLIILGIFVIRIMIELVLPKEYKKLMNAIRFKKGEGWRSDRDLLQWL